MRVQQRPFVQLIHRYGRFQISVTGRMSLWHRKVTLQRFDILRNAKVADADLQLAVLLVDRKLDEAILAGRIGMFDRFAGRADHYTEAALY